MGIENSKACICPFPSASTSFHIDGLCMVFVDSSSFNGVSVGFTWLTAYPMGYTMIEVATAVADLLKRQPNPNETCTTYACTKGSGPFWEHMK